MEVNILAAYFICDKKDRDRPSLNSTLLLIGIGRNCECIFFSYWKEYIFLILSYFVDLGSLCAAINHHKECVDNR